MSYEMTNQILGKRIVAITYPQKGNGETIITFEDGMVFTLGACESLNLNIPAKGGTIEWDKKLGVSKEEQRKSDVALVSMKRSLELLVCREDLECDICENNPECRKLCDAIDELEKP